MLTRQNKIYTIWCVLSDEISLFRVKVESDEPVFTLKEKIKEMNPSLGAFGAQHLQLYHVEIKNFEDMANAAKRKAIEQKLSEHPIEMGAKKILADVFEGVVKDETLIIVQSPMSGK
jgi:Crinkler effector protein N-terminal domain